MDNLQLLIVNEVVCHAVFLNGLEYAILMNDLEKEKDCSEAEDLILSKYKYINDNDAHCNFTNFLMTDGHRLTNLDVSQYNCTDILPVIKDNCTMLNKLKVKFTKVNTADMINIFINMPRLKKLKIEIVYKNITVPENLLTSIQHVAEKLTLFHLVTQTKKYPIYLPNNCIEVFKKLTNLKNLKIMNFCFNDEIKKIISAMKLKKLMINTNTESTTMRISQMPDLLKLSIPDNINNKFLENLVKNRKIKKMDVGAKELNNKSLKMISRLTTIEKLRLNMSVGNSFITKNAYLQLKHLTHVTSLDLSGCKITNELVYELTMNLQDLSKLFVLDTNVDQDLMNLLEPRDDEHQLNVYVGFLVSDETCELYKKGKNICFETKQ